MTDTNTTNATSPSKSSKRRFARPPAEERAAPQMTPSAALTAPPAAKPESKISAVIALLKRGHGATLAELVELTGWQPHTARAALTGLKKKGHAIERTKRDDVTCYTITGEA